MLLGLEGQECHVMPYLVHRFLRSCRAIRLHHVAVLFPVRKTCYSCSVAINPSYEALHSTSDKLLEFSDWLCSLGVLRFYDTD